MPVKTDRNDARGMAQLMRLGWFRPVHCKSMAAQEVRALLTARKLVQSKLHDIENSLRGILRGFGLKVGRRRPAALRHASASWWPAKRAWRLIAQALLAVHAALCASSRALRSGCDRWRAPMSGSRLLMSTPAVGADRGDHLCFRDRRSDALHIVEAGRSAFWTDPEEVSVGRNRHHRSNQQDR